MKDAFRRLKNVGFANLEDIYVGKMSLRYLVKQTLRHFEKSGVKAVAKLVHGFQLVKARLSST